MQARALDELRRLVGYMNHTAAVGVGVTGMQRRPSLGTAAVRPPSSTSGGSVIGAGPSLSDVYTSPDVVTAAGGVCYANTAGDTLELSAVSREGSEDAETQHLSNYSPS